MSANILDFETFCLFFCLEILRSTFNEGISVMGDLERKSHSQDRYQLGRPSNSYNQVSPKLEPPVVSDTIIRALVIKES